MLRSFPALLLFFSVVVAAGAQSLPPRAVESSARFLTNDAGAMDLWPSFSPDGKSVLFSRSAGRGKPWELLVVPANGGTAQKLARSPLPLPVSATRANWSRQNKLIAFTGTSADGRNGVWVIDADGTHLHPLASAGLSDQMFYPSWYPDGKQLAVMDAHDEVIKRIDLESGAVKTMTDRARVLAGMPSVSTDGKWIAFAGQANTGQAYEQTKNVIWLVSDTGVLHTLETPPLQGRAPSWSPDQQRLAFESNRGSPNQSYAIFIINRDGSGLMRVTDYAMNANHPMWSPDGRQLVFSARHANAPSLAIAIIDSPPAAALPPAK